jgi:hypothetical protein
VVEGGVLPLPGVRALVTHSRACQETEVGTEHSQQCLNVSVSVSDRESESEWQTSKEGSMGGVAEQSMLEGGTDGSRAAQQQQQQGEKQQQLEGRAHTPTPDNTRHNTVHDQTQSACVLEQKLENWKPFDIMDTSRTLTLQPSADETDTITNNSSSTNSSTSSIDSPFLKSLNKLVRVLFEFLETEIKFSIDVNKFKTVMSEIKYSTLTSARRFVSSVPYVGILVSTESIKITSNLMVNLFQEATISPKLDSKGNVAPYTDVSSCFECCYENCKAVFNGLERCAPFFPLFASYIINHDGLSNLYREYVADDELFEQYMYSAELLVGEGLLSLLIKPVQRLPRCAVQSNSAQSNST